MNTYGSHIREDLFSKLEAACLCNCKANYCHRYLLCIICLIAMKNDKYSDHNYTLLYFHYFLYFLRANMKVLHISASSGLIYFVFSESRLMN